MSFGERVARWSPLRRIIVGVAIALLVVGLVGYQTDRNSCVRSNGVREALQEQFRGQADRLAQRAQFDVGLERSLDLAGARSARRSLRLVPSLDCGLPFPDTK